MFWPQRFYPNDPVEELMKQWAVLPQPLSGHRLILNISASPYWHGKPAVRRRMIRALAERHGATVVMVNQVGANDSLDLRRRLVRDESAGRRDCAGEGV